MSLNNKYNIIDIRSRDRYLKGHISNSININYADLLTNYKKYLSKEKEYYVYCDSGNKSLILVNKLNNLGYNLVNIEGGYNNYLRRK